MLIYLRLGSRQRGICEWVNAIEFKSRDREEIGKLYQFTRLSFAQVSDNIHSDPPSRTYNPLYDNFLI